MPFAGVQDDKAVDRAWKKESAEAGDGLGQVLYQLFKKRRLADLLVTKLRYAHKSNKWGLCIVDVSYAEQQSNQEIVRPCILSANSAASVLPPPPSPPLVPTLRPLLLTLRSIKPTGADCTVVHLYSCKHTAHKQTDAMPSI